MAAKQADAGPADVTPGREPLHFGFTWDETEGAAAERTMGVLELLVDELVVWPADSGFRWAWIELLDWLALSWVRISHEDGLPFDADPPTLNDLRTTVERQSKYLPSAAAADLEIVYWEFLEAHDLARSLEGAAPPSVIVWREGRLGHILTDTTHVRCEWEGLRTVLTDMGEVIAERLTAIQSSDQAAAKVLERWRTRGDAPLEEVVAAAAGLEGDRLAPVLTLVRRRLTHNDLRQAALVENELLAAARMTSGLPTDLIVDVLNEVADLKLGSTDLIDQVSALVREAVSLGQPKPFEQGHALGGAMREHLGLKVSESFDPVAWAESVGVVYRQITLDTDVVDALACWGPRSGPAVIVNLRGKHSRSAGGRHASVAHEICHLLIDRDGALPVAEVLGGRVNPAVEARARAFAAELLLPRAHAGAIVGQALDKAEARRLVRALARSHQVSQEVVAWQARNSDATFNDDVWETLRRFVSSPWLF